MKVASFLLNITSENPERLIAFYRDVVGLEPNPNMGDSALNICEGAVIAFDGHSQTHGMAKEPQRYLVDLFVEDVEAEQAALKAKGVKFIRELGLEWWGGIISTFEDPDGNYVQVIQFDPSKATENPDKKTAAEATA